jgi:rhodanese-related sulfurtransferase
MMTSNPAPSRPLRRTLRRAALALAVVATLGVASACSTDAVAGGVATAGGLPAGTVLIDVRTPAEFAEGHVEGAINLPVELPTFSAQIELLDPTAELLVYCRSGRRADVAIDIMAQRGLTATNLGTVDQAARATGLRVVR